MGVRDRHERLAEVRRLAAEGGEGRGASLPAPAAGSPLRRHCRAAIDATPFDEYVSDPAKPVPFIDKTGIGMAQEYMTADQRFAGRRPDVLVYQTELLKEDLTIAGPIEVELHVSARPAPTPTGW